MALLKRSARADSRERLTTALQALAHALAPRTPATLVKQAVARDGKGRITDLYEYREPVEVVDVGDDVWGRPFTAISANGLPITLRLERPR